MTAATNPPSDPRHVICILGRERGLNRLADAALSAVEEFADGFTVDRTYSRDEPDDRMGRSFGVCWDRVAPKAWTPADEEAIERHGSVLYVLGPSMPRDNAVGTSAIALRLVNRLIDAGAIAVKGESAGVAHGLARWRELGSQAQNPDTSGDSVALARICRVAFAKRPVASGAFLESVGFHLVGLPDVYVARGLGSERTAVATMDTVADEMKQRGVERVLRERRTTLSYESDYKPGDFKFNPYGIVHIGRR